MNSHGELSPKVLKRFCHHNNFGVSCLPLTVKNLSLSSSFISLNVVGWDTDDILLDEITLDTQFVAIHPHPICRSPRVLKWG